MSIIRGGAGITRVVRGGSDIVQVRRGTDLVWSSNILRDDFNRDDAQTLGDDWTSTGSGFKLGISSKAARMYIPDGILSIAQPLNTDRARFNKGTASQDDYELEFRIGSKGSDNSITGTQHRTQIFARGSNGGTTHGVGVDLFLSVARIVRRVGSTDTMMIDCGAYNAGDIGILRGAGNLHSLYINGSFRGEWNDTGNTAQKGAGYRSLIIRGDGSKDLLGPRRFSASLDYVQLS